MPDATDCTLLDFDWSNGGVLGVGGMVTIGRTAAVDQLSVHRNIRSQLSLAVFVATRHSLMKLKLPFTHMWVSRFLDHCLMGVVFVR